MKKVFLVCLVGLVVSGCAVKKNWTPTGGSRADGTIKLSYEVAMFEQPIVDNAQGVMLASERCKSWGYESAEPFGGILRNCTHSGQYGCERWLVTAEYQCLGDLDKPKTAMAPIGAMDGIVKTDIYEELRKLKVLRDEGIINDSEFETQKTKILANQ